MYRKKTYIIVYLLILFSLVSGLNILTGKDKEIRLSLPDLQKHLGIDRDNIKLSWEEFRKILLQLGDKIKPEYALSDGIVTLKRAQFDQLLKKMPININEPPKAPKNYLISQCRYTGTSFHKNSRFDLNIRIYVFKDNQYVSVPVLTTASAISEILVNEKPGTLSVRGGWNYINLIKKGYHHIKIKFSIENRDQEFSFPIIKSNITSLDYAIPTPGFEFSSDSFFNPKTPSSTSKSFFSAYYKSMNQISLKWHLKRDRIKKKPVLFYAQSNSLLSISSNIIKVKTSVNLEVIQSSLNKVSVLIPEDYKVINTVGASINNWILRNTDIGQVLEVNFGMDINKAQVFNIHFEKMIKPDTLGVSFPGIRVLDSKKETGHLAIIAKNEVEVEVAVHKNLEKIVFHKIPKKILSMTGKPILNTFKYLNHPYKLDLSIHKYKKIEGLSTLIESAKAKVLFLENGKTLHRIEYFIRNSYKQFLELELPPGATIWSVLVGQKREKASSNHKGKVLIPLLRSSGNGDLLKAFKVILIYSVTPEKFSLIGKREILLPKTDIFLNKINMDLYVPNGYAYDIDKMDWKAVKEIKRQVVSKTFEAKKPAVVHYQKGIKRNLRLSKKERQKRKTIGDISRSGRVGEEKMDEREGGIEGGVQAGLTDGVSERPSESDTADFFAKPMYEKLVVAGKQSLTGPVGLNSINISLPLTGQKFSFTKSIVNKSEVFPLEFSFSNKTFNKLRYYIFGIVVILILLFIIFIRIRKRKQK